MAKTNREYKDRLFRFIFGNEANKQWTLSLYNAVNGSHYTNADDVENYDNRGRSLHGDEERCFVPLLR